MNIQQLREHPHRWGIVAGICSVLAACGGGGNESGPAEEIVASPSSVIVSGPTGSCATGTGPTLFVHGGQPPYKLFNSAPTAISLDKAKLNSSGEGVVLTFINGVCLDKIPITIEDGMGRVVNVPVSNIVGT